MTRTRIIAALCTVLDEDESLHVEGLEAHIDEQLEAGIAGLLIAGSMGSAQMLRDDTYRALIEHSVRHMKGRMEMLIGVSDMSLARTLERLRYAEQFEIDGVVATAPWFFTFSPDELGGYFRELADRSTKPLYVYDIPARTGVRLEVDFLVDLLKHPNIVGVKCSAGWDHTQALMERVNDNARLIPAEPLQIAKLIDLGVRHNLDGVYAVLPALTMSIVRAAERGDRDTAAERQRALTDFLSVMKEYGVFAVVSEYFRIRGIPGHVGASPYQPLTEEQQAIFAVHPALKAVIAASD